MTHSAACTEFVAAHEGLRLKSYQDQRGIWTIGYGHTFNVAHGGTCTEEQALKYLSTDLMIADRGVNQAVKVPLTQSQFDALVSLTYNIGTHAFSQSSLVEKLNEGDYAGAAEEFLKWNRAGPKVSLGLVNRRAAERKMFLEAA